MKTWNRGTRLLTSLAAGLALLPASVAGQERTEAEQNYAALALPESGLAAGNRIRVTYRDPGAIGNQELSMEGRFLGVAPDQIRLTTGSTLHAAPLSEYERTIPLDDLVRLEVEGERSAGRGAARGAVIGGLIGAAAGLLFTAVICTDDFFAPCGGKEFVVGSAVVGGVGTGIGAGIGALIGRSEWKEVPLSESR